MTENNENGYIPFTDRVGSNLNRRKLSIVSQTPNEMIVDVFRADGDVTSEGTKLTASKLNEVFNEIKSELTSQDKGTKVKVGGIGQEELEFTSAPQTQIDNVVTELNNKVSLSDLLDFTYPVGAIYLSVNSTSPASLFGGTWEALDEGYTLWTTTTAGTGGETIAAGLPNIAGTFNVTTTYSGEDQDFGLSGAFTNGRTLGFKVSTYINPQMIGIYPTFNASDGECGTQKMEPNATITYANNVYGKSNTVQPPAIRVYAWKRIAEV